jgi:hypothetical protein
MTSPRPYIEPGAEVDCAHFPNPNEYIRGFLRLPSVTETGRVRFTEDIPGFDLSADLVPALPIRLLDGGKGTPGCLLDTFVSHHSMWIPTPSPFPLVLFVNEAIIGSDDAERRYSGAAVQCRGLLDFLGTKELTLDQAAGGAMRVARARATGDDHETVLYECVAIDEDDTDALVRSYGTLVITGEAKSLTDWSRELNEVLLLFAVLADKPLVPDRISADERNAAIDYYAAWQETSAPSHTVPLLTLPQVEDNFSSMVNRWRALRDKAPDLVDNVVEFQCQRSRYTAHDGALMLFRCLELYHSYCERFESVVRGKSEHRAIVRAVREGLADELAVEHGEWIELALKAANRKRLVEQVKDILDDLGPAVVERCFIADPANFASVAKTARNYFTHDGTSPDRRSRRAT